MSTTTYNPVNTQDHDVKILSLKAYQLKLRLQLVELELKDVVGEGGYKTLASK